ncbi:MAG: hypothetical protein JO272_01200 [Pseudonocardiales bacterium]|jgi:hypothetical protein|nr:hypothetical protein [Pseudonocardiales bacterium]
MKLKPVVVHRLMPGLACWRARRQRFTACCAICGRQSEVAEVRREIAEWVTLVVQHERLAGRGAIEVVNSDALFYLCLGCAATATDKIRAAAERVIAGRKAVDRLIG